MKYKHFLKIFLATAGSQILNLEDQLPGTQVFHLESKERFVFGLAGIYSHIPVESDEIPIFLSHMNSPSKALQRKRFQDIFK